MTGAEIFTFNKTLQERFDEYKDILICKEHSIPSSQVIAEWKFYLSEIIQPGGWRALWKLSRLSCDEFSIKFPSVVYVEVMQVNLDILCATINILAVQEDVQLAERIQVPLQQLYPTKQQASDSLGIADTANCLDQLRFFLDHIWQPWDDEDDSSVDWPLEHLENRILLHHDMQSRTVFREAREHIRHLLSNGRTIHNKIAILEDSVGDISKLNDDIVLNLMELSVKLTEIKTELQMLENPVIRNVFIKKKKQLAMSNREGRGPSDVCLVLHRNSVNDCIKIIEQAAQYIPKDSFIRQSPSLQTTLNQAMAGDTIVLCPGVHEVRDSYDLEEEGLMRGVDMPDKTCVRACSVGSRLFDCSADTFVFESLTIETHMVNTALVVHQGTVILRNCRVVCKDERCQGVSVFTGAKFEAQNCHFSGLNTAIIVDNEGEIALESCKFVDCNVGLQCFAEPKVSLHMCHFSGCKDSAIKIESLLMGDDSNTESLNLFEGHSKIKLQDTTFENNTNGNVSIRKCNTKTIYETITEEFH